MKNKKYFLLLLSSFLLGCSEKEIDEIPLDTHDPFSFAGNYENPELTIDGKDDEEEWKSEWASETYTISYVSKADSNQEKQVSFKADFKLYRGEKEIQIS